MDQEIPFITHPLLRHLQLNSRETAEELTSEAPGKLVCGVGTVTFHYNPVSTISLLKTYLNIFLYLVIPK